MRKKVWIWFIRKTTKPLTAISVAVTILVIFNYTIDMVIASSKIIVELNETKITTIENPARRIDDRPSITDRQTESGTRDTERTDESIEEKIRETFPEEPEIAVAVAKAESGHNPLALNDKNTNGSTDKGLFQINSCHGYGDELFDIDTNLEVARKLYDKSGWTPWVAYTTGAYTNHLNIIK